MDDIDGDASPMADEPPHLEPVLAEAAAEPSPYGYAHEVHRILSALLLLSASGRFPVHTHLRHDPEGFIVVTHLIGGWDGAYGNGGFGGVPASEEAMAALPEMTVQGEGEIVGEKECAVCLETYEVGDTLRTLPCLHDFRWLRVSRLCPLCRFALPAAESLADEEDDDGDDDGEGEEDDDNTLEI